MPRTARPDQLASTLARRRLCRVVLRAALALIVLILR